MILATTTYTVWRSANVMEDAADPQDYEVHLSGIEGNTVYLSGSESVVGGDRERVDGRILVDGGLDIKHYDYLVDDTTGDTWQVAYARNRTGLDLDHMVLGVYQVTGVARGTRDL